LDVGYVVLATIAIIAIAYLSLVLNNAREGKNDILEKVSVAGIAVTITFVVVIVVADSLGYRLR